jgi:hypothetical protein
MSYTERESEREREEEKGDRCVEGEDVCECIPAYR